MENKELIGKALGRIPSGLFIVTYFNEEENKQDGILMSWIQQISFEPAMLTIAMNKSRSALENLKKAKKFVVNILGQQNQSVMVAFAKGGMKAIESGEIKYKDAIDANAVVIEDSLCSMEVELVDVFTSDTADHHILTAKVNNAHLHNLSEDQPSIHLRNSGFNY